MKLFSACLDRPVQIPHPWSADATIPASRALPVWQALEDHWPVWPVKQQAQHRSCTGRCGGRQLGFKRTVRETTSVPKPVIAIHESEGFALTPGACSSGWCELQDQCTRQIYALPGQISAALFRSAAAFALADGRNLRMDGV